MKKILLLSIVFFTGILASSCRTAPQHYLYTEIDSGTVLTCSKGDIITVQLESNPTTGYQWELTAPTDYLTILPSKPVFVSSSESHGSITGAPGYWICEFKALDGGDAPVSAVYRRSWEKDQPPAKRFDLLIRVQGESLRENPREDEDPFIRYIQDQNKTQSEIPF